MTDSISVLLLIGSAVVGPIEAQELPPICPEAYEARPWPSTMNVSRLFCVKEGKEVVAPLVFHESLDQLCERAMREIGALNDGRWYMPPQTRDEQLSPQFVRCIATPKGYRR